MNPISKIPISELDISPYTPEQESEYNLAVQEVMLYLQYCINNGRVEAEHVHRCSARGDVPEQATVNHEYMPLDWLQFMGMKETRRIEYLRHIEVEYKATTEMIAAMFAVPETSVISEISKLMEEHSGIYLPMRPAGIILPEYKEKWNCWLKRFDHKSGQFNPETLHPYNKYREKELPKSGGKGRFTLIGVAEFSVDTPIDDILDNMEAFDELLESFGI